MSALYGVPLDAAARLIVTLSSFATPVVAIVLFTVVVRLATMPLSVRAIRGQAAQARIAPKTAELRKRYRQQPEKLNRELTALYKKEGTSMFAGFGPLLVQWPFLSVAYLSVRRMNGTFLGIRLGTHLLSSPGLASTQGLAFLAVFVVLAAIGYVSLRLNDALTSSRFTWAMPLVSVGIAAFSPLTAGVYLVTTAAWTMMERRVFRVVHPESGENAADARRAGRPRPR
jgi:YidC/Oxa1 family membrane protein insertase